jgi:hypothetical protein
MATLNNAEIDKTIASIATAAVALTVALTG